MISFVVRRCCAQRLLHVQETFRTGAEAAVPEQNGLGDNRGIGRREGDRPEERLQVVRQLRTVSVAGVHRDEDAARRRERHSVLRDRHLCGP